MDLYDVMRTTFAARDFTSEPVPDDVLARILDNARFAPSGGNRQGWHVIVVRDPAKRAALGPLIEPTFRRYLAEVKAGANPWNTVAPADLDQSAVDAVTIPEGFIERLVHAPTLLLVTVDLAVVAAMDQHLPRIGVVPGASIYPFVWNILLAARNEGFGGTLDVSRRGGSAGQAVVRYPKKPCAGGNAATRTADQAVDTVAPQTGGGFRHDRRVLRPRIPRWLTNCRRFGRSSRRASMRLATIRTAASFTSGSKGRVAPTCTSAYPPRSTKRSWPPTPRGGSSTPTSRGSTSTGGFSLVRRPLGRINVVRGPKMRTWTSCARQSLVKGEVHELT